MKTLFASKPLTDVGWSLIFAAWLIASLSTLAALFFGEVMQLPICSLCWYQRIAMFPLMLILPAGLFPLDPKVFRYALPLASLGTVLAIFHYLLQVGIIPESLQPCRQGIPCSQTVIEWFGFLTLPLLSMMAFSTILLLLLTAYTKVSK